MSFFDTALGALPSNFNSASISQKVAELGDKLSSSGMTSMFAQANVDPTSVSDDLQSAIKDQFTQAQALASGGTSAGLLPGSSDMTTEELRVIISQDPTIGDDPNELVFIVMPKIDESRSVEYDSVTPVHHPGAILKYRNTSTRKWSVSGRLISRTVEEATDNLAIVNMIRSWAMPFYGEGTAQTFQDKLGAPPPILTLRAYGPTMIGPVKCVLTSYSMPWDNSIDYIPTDTGNPFPVILDISLSLEESYSPAEYSGFDLLKFKQGDLSDTGAFSKPLGGPSPGYSDASLPTKQDVLDTSSSLNALPGDFTRADRLLSASQQAAQDAITTSRGFSGSVPVDPTAPAVFVRSIRRTQSGG